MNAPVTPILAPTGRDAAHPNAMRPDPTAARPVVHDATGPNALMNLELTNADMKKLTNANDVNAMPTACVEKFSRFWSRGGKNAKNALSAAWYKAETQATLATPVHSLVPSGQDIISEFD
mmetsp:Transcript_15803/g.28565  ORF Transcript_15803/g.28565 Transcript_15803/m.28565 type:complete len:120 (+) Transcript_15803:759-1118(+)